MELMIDLETLGNKPNSAVLQIGAVFFDIEKGTLGETFEAFIDFEDAMRYGKVTPSTLKWWMGQNDEARRAAIKGVTKAKDAWEAFYNFCQKHGRKIHPWGNGSVFDITICNWQFAAVLQKESPWDFWNVQDCRTIKRLAHGVVRYDGEHGGVAHRALDDAVHQAKFTIAYYQGLRKNALGTPVQIEEKDDLILDLD